MAHHVVASDLGPRSAARWLSLGAACAAALGGVIWLARDVGTASKPSAIVAVPAPLSRAAVLPSPLATITRGEQPRAESAAVVTAAFTATPSPTADRAKPARSFTSHAEELSFLQARTSGEALTLEGLQTSEQALTRVLEADGATTPENRASLEQRRELLRVKLATQRARVEQTQSRIAELERVGGAK